MRKYVIAAVLAWEAESSKNLLTRSLNLIVSAANCSGYL